MASNKIISVPETGFGAQNADVYFERLRKSVQPEVRDAANNGGFRHFIEKASDFFHGYNDKKYDASEFEKLTNQCLNKYFEGTLPMLQTLFFMSFPPIVVQMAVYDMFVIDA